MSMTAPPTTAGARTSAGASNDLTDDEIQDLMRHSKVNQLVQLAMTQGAQEAGKERDALTTKLADACDQIDLLQEQLNKAEAAAGAGNPDIRQYTDKIARLNREIRDLNAEIASLRTQLRSGGAARGGRASAKDANISGTLSGLGRWVRVVFTHPRLIMELFALLMIIGAMLRLWVVGGDFSLNGLASMGIIPKNWSSAPTLDLLILGKVTGFHLYQVAISLIETLFTPVYFQWNRGFPIKLRRQSFHLTLVWLFSFGFLDLGTSFRGISEWMRTGITWESYTDITLPQTGTLHFVVGLTLGTIIAYVVEPVITDAIDRIRRLPNVPVVHTGL